MKALFIYLLLLPAMAFAHGGTTSQSHSIRASNNLVSTNSVKPQSLATLPVSNTTTPIGVDAESDLVLRIQYALNQLAYGVGKPDGILGEKTVKAIKYFQADNDMVIDGKPSDLLLDALLRKVRG